MICTKVFLFISLSLFSFTTGQYNASHGLPRGFPCGELLHDNPRGKPCGVQVVVKVMVTTTAKCNARGCGTLSEAGTRGRSPSENFSISDPEAHIKSALVVDNFNQKKRYKFNEIMSMHICVNRAE